MADTAFDQRNRQVLLAVITEYVETGEPVGSRAVSRRHVRGLSPATIRNAMADLEELGYLAQPHTSAGRVPTDKAYRFYVEHLGRVPWSSAKAQEVGREALLPHADATEKLMAETPAHLSAGTHMTGMLLAPPLKHTALERIELVALGEDRALVVVVTDTGWVTARGLTPMPRLGAEELRETGRALTRRCRATARSTSAAPPTSWIIRTSPTWRRCAPCSAPSKTRRGSSICSPAWPRSAGSR